ncbi:NYN domain-containing protein [Nocardia amamiensis]|uniref:NYN domain-containing protein n=1 Tax=Nocardia amamiensis TaxID=404578 RepID=A0ABS0CZN5_9NOCA|nr:NYN domain-containing protein [Nocardia amamiensis]MBF6302056.1 NYN domain-containing protein [Nocardia amamiensis]
MSPSDEGVLLVDWENLTGAIIGRGKLVERTQVDDLWKFASRRCGDQLHHAHMAAARFDPTIILAMRESMIKAEQVRSTKEQADILLTVLAMDYLHAGIGHFFLVTGDQDFIPLISRIRGAGRKVTVIYGDRARLSRELQRVLTGPGLDSVDIAEVTKLRERKADTGCRSMLGLLELQRRGYILGGKEKGERTAVLNEWGILENVDETQYWSLISTATEKVTRPDAAFPDNGKWSPRSAVRTYLKLGSEDLADITAVDQAIRWISSSTRGLTMSGLRVGPFRTDDGSLLERALDALLAIRLIRKAADGTLSLVGPPLQLGYLEQLWRVFAGVTAECYRRSSATIPFNQLEPLLARKGVGQGKDQRAASRIKEAVNYAKAAGVVDVVAVDGRRHVLAPHSPLSQSFEQAYHAFYAAYHDRLGEQLSEDEVIALMEAQDETRAVPYFGYELRDRQRFLRVLAQSQLLTWRDKQIVVTRSGWGDAGLALYR